MQSILYREMSFDIVIPLGPNDYSIIQETIQYTKKNVVGYRNIYIVTNSSIDIPGCIIIDEAVFPYTLDTITNKIEFRDRAGWYLQQIIKLTAWKYIPEILDYYLVLDSDVYILKPTIFIDNNIPLYAYGIEHHIPYFDHMKRMHPDLKREKDMSGICHHMVFNRVFLKEMFEYIERNTSTPFINAFMDAVTIKGSGTSGASEYELYFNYMIAKHSDKIHIRPLIWKNTNSFEDDGTNDFIAVHHYSRN
jgi:uncharacterized short protein YbdD (DUF466 family)